MSSSASKKCPEPSDFADKADLDRIDPWVNVRPDCKKQTGGDWYRLFLAASLGKKAIHGVNTAPSMEVLGKVPITPDENMAVGFIRWDDRTVKPDLLGSRISDKFYAGHHYRGGQTKSGAFVAFDEGSWEPSLRTRARASAILAAGIAAHGCTKAEALETARLITSDDIDAEAVDSTMLPASHLKREMTTVAKTSHLVFTQGTLQQGILWDDSRLSLDQFAPHVAYDWGRITAIARYIAEANIQICSRFRQAALGMGIAYHIARNSWAEVSEEDFQLHPSLFSTVPRIDLAKVGVPSLKGAYLDHEQEVFVAFTRFLNTEPIHPTSEAYRGIVHLQRATKARHSKKQRVKVATISEILPDEAETHAHTMSDFEIKTTLLAATSPMDLLASAVHTRLSNDTIFRTTVERFMSAGDELTSGMIDHTCKLVFNTATWILAGGAAKEAAKALDDQSLHGRGHDLLLTQLAKLKGELFGVATHIDTRVIFTDECMAKLRSCVRELIARSRKVASVPRAPHHYFVPPAAQEANDFVSSLGDKAPAILAELRANAAKSYKQAAMITGKEDIEGAVQKTANYMMASVAIKTLGLRTCLLRHTGYIDGSVPKETYVYKAAKKLQDKFDYGKPKLKYTNHINAQHVADDLDLSSLLLYSVKAAVAYTTQTLDFVMGELSMGHVYQAPEELMVEALEFVPGGDSPQYDTAELDGEDDLATIEAILASADEEVRAAIVDNFQKVLDTYPNPEVAEKYAILNGYENFRAAYNDLEFGAANDDENRFVLLATSKLPPEEQPKPKRKKTTRKAYAPML